MITNSDIEHYQTYGFIKIKNVFDINHIEKVKQDVKALFSETPLTQVEFDQQLFALFKSDIHSYIGTAKASNYLPSFHTLGMSESLFSILRQLNIEPLICARPLMWFHNRHLAVSDNYFKLPAHQEWSNMQGSLSGAVVWTPLVEVTESMGFLKVIPSSHLDGFYDVCQETNPNYPLQIQHEFAESDFIDVKVELGEALIFHPMLVHKSGVNKTEQVRWTVNFRYNNSLDKNFRAENFFNPFLFSAPESIKTEVNPTAEMVRDSLNEQFSNGEKNAKN